MNRSRTLPVLLVTLAVLAAGFVGATAVQAAGPITKAQVKKIAKSVVKSQGKKLTVTDSNNLGGKPPTAYQDTALSYSSNVAVAASTSTVILPLPVGKYVVSWSAYLNLSAGTGRAGCWIYNDQGAAATTYTADDVSDPGSTGAGYSGTGLVDVTTGDVIGLYCSASAATFTTTSTDPLQVVAQPVDSVTTATLPTTPRPAGAARP